MTQTRATLWADFLCIEFLVTKIIQQSPTSTSSYSGVVITSPLQAPPGPNLFLISCEAGARRRSTWQRFPGCYWRFLSRMPNAACEVLQALSWVQHAKHLGGQQPQPPGRTFLQCSKRGESVLYVQILHRSSMTRRYYFKNRVFNPAAIAYQLKGYIFF